jgi:flagellar biosynthesis protein FliQ
MSIKSVFLTLVLSAVIIPSLAAIAQAQTQGNETTLNMETLTCKENRLE